MRKTLLKLIPSALLLVLLIGLFLPTTVSAKKPSSDEIRDEIANLEQEQADLEASLKKLEQQLSDNRNDLEAIIKKKDVIDQEVTIISGQIANTNERIAAYSLLIADKQAELDEAREDLEYLRKKYKERIRAMEEGGTVSYWTVLFEASSFSDLLDRLNMIQEIAEADAGKIDVLDKATKEVEAAKLALDEEKKTLDTTRVEMEKKQLQLSQKREEANALLAELISKEEEWKKLLSEQEDAADELMDRLADLAEELTEAEKREIAEKEAQLQNQRPTYKDSDGVLWALPTDYRRRSSDYGYRTHPVTGEKEKKHNGVDLTAPTGTPIYATRSGKVTFVGFQEKGAGNYVNIQHDGGYISTYMHMDSYIVKKGDFVHIGQLIGYVGNTGGSTGPHLHFGIKKNGAWVNPAHYLELPYYYKK